MVTASGVQALNVAIRCMLDPGDEGLVLTPAWPNGASIVAMSNAKAVEMPHALHGDRYMIDFDALEAAVTPRTRLLLYTSPSNPLGWVATDEEQTNCWTSRGGTGCGCWQMRSMSGFLYRACAPAILKKATRDDAVVVVQSFSKATA